VLEKRWFPISQSEVGVLMQFNPDAVLEFQLVDFHLRVVEPFSRYHHVSIFRGCADSHSVIRIA
jgi:hypothetical protein